MRTPASTFGPFQSPLPVWGATISKCIYFTESLEKFQSTLPVWGATSREMTVNGVNAISIHAPRVGSDEDSAVILFCGAIFQSTLPVWGATRGRYRRAGAGRNFNPRSPCGERLTCASNKKIPTPFQSTLPVWGATHPYAGQACRGVFQSTLPVWGATLQILRISSAGTISIHAPRVGSDVIMFKKRSG